MCTWRSCAVLPTSAAWATRCAGSRSSDWDAVRELDRLLTQHRAQLGVEGDEHPDRWQTAAAVRSLLDDLVVTADDGDVVTRLAATTWPTTAAAARRSLDTAQTVADALRGAQWQVFGGLASVTDERVDEARSLLLELVDVSRRDELSAALAPVLGSVASRGLTLLTRNEPRRRPAWSRASAGQGAYDGQCRSTRRGGGPSQGRGAGAPRWAGRPDLGDPSVSPAADRHRACRPGCRRGSLVRA